MRKKIIILLFLASIFTPVVSLAQNILLDVITTSKARVITIESQDKEDVPGTDTQTNVQVIDVEVLEGADKGSIVNFKNDYVMLNVGDEFYLTKTVSAENGKIYYTMGEPYRLNTLLIFILLFVFLVIIFGGKQGVRGLLSLIGSLVLIVYVFLPGILHGYSPIWMSLLVASFIIILGSYITHGFNKTTSTAVIGMIVTILITGVLAHYAIKWTHLTGFASEESTYLNFDTRGQLDFVGILFGGMLIGLLGVLYDAAIGQAISVEELHTVAPHLSRWKIYRRALRIGKEHVGALVNTLAIAYVGVSLPLLLLFYGSSSPFLQIINRENFSTEVIRTMIGSIGLVLAVPITTLIATLMIVKKTQHASNVETKKEEKELEHFEHYH